MKLKLNLTTYSLRTFSVLAVLMVLAIPLGLVFAAHPEVSLSNFEIDSDANMIQDDADPSIDWLTANGTSPVIVVQDEPSGQNDDSFGQGSKEDTAEPVVVDGSIPPNKSDLLEFGVYVEEEVGGPGFMHLFWTRVQDPSGTTNMDFEFNKNKCVLDEFGDPTGDSMCSANLVTPLRSVGDLLITYDLSKGGTVPELSLREWDGSMWGPETDLDASNLAAGSINTSLVPAGTTVSGVDLGPYDPRTFGEATIDLDAVFDSGLCESFGSAYLKSRSSDSFTAALKDFIAPEPVNITNCGKVIIRKITDPAGGTDNFGFTTDLDTSAATDPSFNLAHGESQTYDDVLFGTGYDVIESSVVSGYDLTSINCGASTGVTPVIDLANETVTFDIDDATDVLDCTFTNTARGTIIVEKQTDPDGASGDFTFTGNASGTISDGGKITVNNLVPGTYTSTENDPTPAFDLTDITCDDANSSGNTGTRTATFNLEAGETVTCVFTNTQRGSITIVKNATPDHEQDFPFTSTELGGFTLDDDGDPDNTYANSITFSNLVPGTFYVTESAVSGWNLTGITCSDGDSTGDTGTRTATILLAAGENVTCTFANSGTGNIIVAKVTNPAGSSQSFNFNASYDEVGFSLTDGNSNNSGSLVAGTYSVSEDAVAGWSSDGGVCSDGSDPASIGLDPGETVTCTFTNTTGAIKISKTAKNYTAGGLAALAGATFKVEDGDGLLIADNLVTDSNGEICMGGLAVDVEYTVTETAAPTGYALDDENPRMVTAAAAECGAGGAGTPAPVGFVNDPLSEIVITFNSLAGNGVTVATNVSCTGPSAAGTEQGPLGNGESATFTNLLEGSYTCTIIIDP